MDNVVCYGQIKGLTLNDNSVSAKVEIELERGLIDDLMDLKRRGQFRLVLEPFQKRLGEKAMAEIRAFAEAHPYVRVEVPASGCDHPLASRHVAAETGIHVCRECGEMIGSVGPEAEGPEAEARSHELNAEQDLADNAQADKADAEFEALADLSRNNRRPPATAEDKQEQAEAADRLAHRSSP